MSLPVTAICHRTRRSNGGVICGPEMPLAFMAAAAVLVNLVFRTVSANEKGDDLCR